MRRVQRLLDERIIRQVTPIFDTRALGYSSMLVAAKVDAENPWRAAKIINAHPGVSHNYLRNHEFNIWFTIATEPDSQLGLEGTLDVLAERGRRRVDPPAADAEAVQDPHGPRDGGRHRGARQGRRGRRAGRDRAAALRRVRHRRDPRAPGRHAGRSPSPTRRPPRELGITQDAAARAPRAGCRSAGCCAASPRSCSTAAPASAPTAWASGRCPDDRIMELGHADGGVPRHLALLPAADLRGLALLGLHDGPRALQGGVRRDPRLDRRGHRHRRARDALLVDRVQEDPAPVLHRRLPDWERGARVERARLRSTSGRCELHAGRRQLAGPGDAVDRPRPDLHRVAARAPS